ncbi:hypothetical protein D3C72_1093980 [compost metagenome]
MQVEVCFCLAEGAAYSVAQFQGTRRDVPYTGVQVFSGKAMIAVVRARDRDCILAWIDLQCCGAGAARNTKPAPYFGGILLVDADRVVGAGAALA